MKAWFATLSPRDRIIVTGGGGLLIMALLVGSWFSFVDDVERMREVVSEQRVVSQWMESAAQEALILRKGGNQKRVANSGSSLLSLVDQTARRSGLGSAMTRVEPDGSDKVRIRLERVNFDKMMRWLEELQTKHVVSIDSITVDQHQDSGMANVRLSLKGAG
ncbi:MAG: type II secretion system protein M [Gammaproteobacteria bacterium]|nr:type II secretion system protein M [Gammaproteobacteria bacterium]